VTPHLVVGADRGVVLDLRERLDFEQQLQWLRLSFFLAPVLILLAFGGPASPWAVWIAVVLIVSVSWVGLSLRYAPQLVLQTQLWLRVLDCGLLYVVLTSYQAFLHEGYYDAVYVLFAVAAAATHGRQGAWIVSAVAGAAVFISRLQPGAACSSCTSSPMPSSIACSSS